MRTILLALIVLAIPLATAEEVFDDWVYQGDQFEFDSNTAAITVAGSDTIKVTVNGQDNLIISPGEIRRWNEYIIEYVQIDKDICDHSGCEPKLYGKVDPTTGQIIPGVLLQIDKATPEIEIEREFSETEVLVGTTLTVDVILENTGNAIAQDLEYIDAYPEELEVLSTTRGTVQDNKVVFTLGSMTAGQSTQFRYKIRVNENIEATLSGDVSFTSEGVRQEYQSSGTKLSIRDVFEFASELDPTNLEVTNTTEWTFSINNTNSEDEAEKGKISSLTIDIPEYLEVLDYPKELDFINGIYKVEDVLLASGEDLEYEFEFKSDFPGSYEINVTYDTFFRKVLPTQIETINLQYTNRTPVHEYEIEIYPSNRDYLEGDIAYAWIYVRNNDQEASLTNIKVNMTLENETLLFTQDRVEPDQAFSFERQRFRLPFVEESIEWRGKINLTMNSQLTGESINVEDSFSFDIKDVKDAFSITKSAQNTDLEQNETTIVTVTIKNNLENGELVGLQAEQFIPEQFREQEVNPRTISLDDDDEVDVFVFPIRAPFQFNENQSTLTTNVSVGGVYQDATLDITVTIPEPQFSISRDFEGEISLGSTLEELFTLQNTHDDAFFNIKLEQQRTPGVDIGERSSSTINQLDVGESITLPFPIRLSKLGTIDIMPAVLSIEDEFGNIQTFDIAANTIQVENNNVVGPMFSITRNILQLQNRKAIVEALVYNTGSQGGEFVYSDQTYTVTQSLEASEFARFQYELDIPATETVLIPQATVAYQANDVGWNAFSSPVNLTRELQPELQLQEEQNVTEALPTVTQQQSTSSSSLFSGASKPGDVTLLLFGAGGLVVGVGIFFVIRKKFMKDHFKKKRNLKIDFNDHIH